MENKQTTKRKEYLWIQVIEYNPAKLDYFSGTAKYFTLVTDIVFLSFLLLGLCPRGCFTDVLSSQAKLRSATECFCTETALENT